MAFDNSPERIQKIVDSDPEADYYCTNGYLGYVDIAYPGKHIRNVHDKSNTFTVEGINVIIFLFYGGEVDVFQESLKRSEMFWNCLCRYTMISVWLK